MKYQTILDIGRQKRQQDGINEDSIAVADLSTSHRDTEREAGVFIVADGAGGHQDGDVASYIASEQILEELAPYVVSSIRQRPTEAGLELDLTFTGNPPSTQDVEEMLEDAISTAHCEILKYATENKAEPLTTVVVAVVMGNQLHYAWVGDSRLYLINRSHEQISLLTRDHSVVEEMRQRGEIGDIEAMIHQQGNRITRALGGSHYEDPEMSTVEVDTGTVPLYGDDVLLLTSDGLIDAWTDAPFYHDRFLETGGEEREAVIEEIRRNAVTDGEIRDVVLAADEFQAATETLVRIANKRGGKDNLSIVLAETQFGELSPSELPPRGIDEAFEDIESRETIIAEESQAKGKERTQGEDGKTNRSGGSPETASSPNSSAPNDESSVNSDSNHCDTNSSKIEDREFNHSTTGSEDTTGNDASIGDGRGDSSVGDENHCPHQSGTATEQSRGNIRDFIEHLTDRLSGQRTTGNEDERGT